MTKYREFDRNRLLLKPLQERAHDYSVADFQPLKSIEPVHPSLQRVAKKVLAAHHTQSSVILMMGAHLLRRGLQRYLIDMLERGWISCIAMNGAGIIHDYELALCGATTESVRRYIKTGEFGLWHETGYLNDIIKEGQDRNEGLGEAVGRAIVEADLPHREHSIVARAYQLDVPVTVHVGVGYDIIHEHPNCEGTALGATSYRDFLFFTAALEQLVDGVVMNFGSAVMAPEVYLKALAMVRNVAAQEDREITNFTTLVCDLMELPSDFRSEPSRSEPAYYYRPLKTMLVRTVADGGESHYVQGDHAETLPQLWTALYTGSR